MNNPVILSEIAPAAQTQISAFIAESRRLNGQTIKERPLWNTAVTADAIRHFAYGISDDNPLWLDPAYAAESRYGRLVAPPTFLISVLYPLLHGAPVKVPLTNLIGGLELEWFLPVLEGDTFSAAAKQVDVIASEDRKGRPVVYILAETTYHNQREELVGQARGTIVWIAREADELLLDRPVYHYNQTKLQAIEAAIQAEVRTGRRALTPAELVVGQKLPPLVRGPLTIGDLICWQAAIGPSYRAGTLGYRDCLAKPHTAAVMPGVGWPVKYSQQHEDFNMAAQRGMPAPFDNSAMRLAWLSVLLTNWMGDEGFLKRLKVNTNAPVIYGDTLWYEGTITHRTDVDEGVVVTIKIIGTNQLDQITTSGEAEIFLPRQAISFHDTAGLEQAQVKEDPASLVLTEVERHRLLVEWNDTRQDYPSCCLHDLFEVQVGQTPAGPAVVDENERLTYRQLDERANRLAHYLHELGIGPDTVIGICLERSVEMVVGILAILKAGGAYLPLDATYPAERLAFMLQDARAPVLLTQQSLLERLPKIDGTVLALETIHSTVAEYPSTTPAYTVTPDNLAYVLYTSGSTATPKGVAITHAGAALYIRSIRNPLGITANDVYLHTASFSFSASTRQLWLPLCTGATLVIAAEHQQRDPLALFKLIQQRQITVWDTVPSIWRYCLKMLAGLSPAGRATLLDNRLRAIFTTGEPLHWETIQTWRNEFGHPAHVVNLYSQTETTGTVCIYPAPADFAETGGIVPLGRPVENTQVYLLDEQRQLVPIGQTGEVYVGDARLAKGYLNQPELTAEKFLANPFTSPEPGGDQTRASSRLYRTGDLARYRPDGVLEPMGRSDDQIKLRGHRIRLKEIEAVLRQHPSIVESVVMARDNAGQAGEEKRLVAYLVPTEQPGPTVGEIYHFLEAKLPAYMIPAAFVTLETLPLNPNGKVDRQALPIPEQVRPNLDADLVLPTGPVEEMLAEVWQEVLGVDQVGVHDDFFQLGGHSLLATQIVAQLQHDYDIEIPLRLLFESPTIAKLARNIEEILLTEMDDS